MKHKNRSITHKQFILAGSQKGKQTQHIAIRTLVNQADERITTQPIARKNTINNHHGRT